MFVRDGMLLRQVNACYQKDLDALFDSGLYDELVAAGMLVPVEQVDLSWAPEPNAIAVLRPERVTTLSYPYEWSFGQWKDAALLTLELMRRSLGRGMVLKDASAFNVQYVGGRPMFIDTLSFQVYEEGEPWIAYAQFCRHFLAPLALMSFVDVRMGGLFRAHLDGIPLDLASRMLPWRTRTKPGLLTHLHLHATAQSHESAKGGGRSRVSKVALLALIESLRGTIAGLDWSPTGTTWADYYRQTNYTDDAMREKMRLVGEFIGSVGRRRGVCWDLGANTGRFSRLAAEHGYETVAWDIDPAAVESAYRQVRTENETRILPLLQDLTNPTPGLGWAGTERMSFAERGPADILLALALIHHLVIGGNVPLRAVSEMFANLGEWLVIEFVPPTDSQVQRMLAGRRGVILPYDQAVFEKTFAVEFEIVRRAPISGTERTLYLMRRRRP